MHPQLEPVAERHDDPRSQMMIPPQMFKITNSPQAHLIPEQQLQLNRQVFYPPCSHQDILSYCLEPSVTTCVHRSVTATQLNKRRRSTGDPPHSTPPHWSLPSISLPSQGTLCLFLPLPLQMPQKRICHISSFFLDENQTLNARKY